MHRGGFRISSVKERINTMKKKDSNRINKSVERDINVCILEISLALDKMKNGQDKEIGKHIRMLKALTLLLQSMRDELNTYGVVDVQRINSVWSLFDDMVPCYRRADTLDIVLESDTELNEFLIDVYMYIRKSLSDYNEWLCTKLSK